MSRNNAMTKAFELMYGIKPKRIGASMSTTKKPKRVATKKSKIPPKLERVDRHLACPNWPNCEDEGCGGDSEPVGHKGQADEPATLTVADAPGWEQVGEVGVDAGMVWIGDPCYCVTPDCDEHPAATWREFCDQLGKNEIKGTVQWNYRAGHPGLGVTVTSGYGDGCYPVLVKRARDGRRIAAALVVFMPEELEQP